MVVTAAAFVMFVVVIMVMVLMLMFVAVAFLIMVVVMVVLVFTAALIIILAAIAAALATACVVIAVVVVDDHSLSVLMLMVMLMIVAVTIITMIVVVMAVAFVLIDLIQEAAVIDRIMHLVMELVLINIENSGHEREVDLVLRGKFPVLLDSVVQVCKVESDSRTVIQSDCCFDVTEQLSCFGLYPFTDDQHCTAKSGFRIGIPASDPSGDSGGNSAGFFQRCLFSAHFIIS